MRADVGIGPYEVVCNKALNYNLIRFPRGKGPPCCHGGPGVMAFQPSGAAQGAVTPVREKAHSSTVQPSANTNSLRAEQP